MKILSGTSVIGRILLAFSLMIFFGTGVSAYTYTASVYRDTIRNYDEAYAAMYEAAAAGEESADLSAYGIRVDDIIHIYSDLLTSAPEFFYLENRISYSYQQSGAYKTVTQVQLRYTLTGDALDEAKLGYEQELAYIVSQVNPALSETEKALWVHDYLISVYGYDDSQTYYDAYSLFRERKGVCQAYSLAYIAVLRELGMEAVMVSSEVMNHAWNLVKVDGEWYHADLVFDDPSPDRIGRVLHENFLLDDSMIAQSENPHTGWESSIPCTSSAFADAFWKDIASPMVWFGGQWYFIDSETNTLVVTDENGNHRSDIFTFDEKWYVDGGDGRYWVGVFSGVSEILGQIFINTPHQVMIYNPENSQAAVYLEAEPGERIFGSRIYKNTLEYLIADAPEPSADASDEARRVDSFMISDFIPEKLGKPLPFDDVSRLDSYYAAVRYVYSRGLFQGVSSTKFAPSAPLTRAMFVTVLGRLCGVDPDGSASSHFTDIPDGQWYTPYVDWAARKGIVNGVGDNRFNPMGEITHEQMIKIVAGLGQLLGLGTTDTSDSLVLFDDRAEISSWAVDSVTYCVTNKLIENGGLLEPKMPSSRAEAAEIVARFAKLYGDA